MGSFHIQIRHIFDIEETRGKITVEGIHQHLIAIDDGMPAEKRNIQKYKGLLNLDEII